MGYFIITSTIADVYNAPGFTNSVVTQGIFGESPRILRQEQNWLYIEMEDGYRGWVHSSHGIIKDATYPANYYTLNLFSRVLDQDRKFLKQLVFGSRLYVTRNKNGSEVQLPDGIVGLLDGAERVFKPAGNKRDMIIDYARLFLGLPYRWGGRSTFGFDCSGLVQTVFKAVGLNVPRDAWQQEEYLGKHSVNTCDLEKGDLLFFSENMKATHVGISLGAETFIHARGEVRINSLDATNNLFSKKLSDMNVVGKSINSLLK